MTNSNNNIRPTSHHTIPYYPTPHHLCCSNHSILSHNKQRITYYIAFILYVFKLINAMQ